jgi:hypothetical protein
MPYSFLKASLLGAACSALLFSATPSNAAALSSADDLGKTSALPLVQQISHGAPAGARCVKWTRRWNTRHGVGHRRCVQWR